MKNLGNYLWKKRRIFHFKCCFFFWNSTIKKKKGKTRRKMSIFNDWTEIFFVFSSVLSLANNTRHKNLFSRLFFFSNSLHLFQQKKKKKILFTFDFSAFFFSFCYFIENVFNCLIDDSGSVQSSIFYVFFFPQKSKESL